ncbi:MAG: galactose mutarotase [Rhodobacteraceae bacterium]|nr:galactose mutarotase [Paracoccaceae bacterium]
MGEIGVFGQTRDGRDVRQVTLQNGDLRVVCLAHGARVHEVTKGASGNLVASSDTVAGYEGPDIAANSIIGPVANRISGARAMIGGKEYRFEANQDGRICLHSGSTGSHGKLWEIVERRADHVTFEVNLPDGEGGFPGNRTLRTTYALTDDRTLGVTITAGTDALTLMNPVFHPYWRLSGDSWAGHRLHVPAAQYLPRNADSYPTGEIADVAGSAFDLRQPVEPTAMLDNCYCFAPSEGALRLMAAVTGPGGERLEVHSVAPALQVYCGRPDGIALEPQLWPDAPNNPHFPSILLGAGERFLQKSLYILDI